jgi:hypothetical protein
LEFGVYGLIRRDKEVVGVFVRFSCCAASRLPVNGDTVKHLLEQF